MILLISSANVFTLGRKQKRTQSKVNSCCCPPLSQTGLSVMVTSCRQVCHLYSSVFYLL